MIPAWFNTTVTIQRRTILSRNDYNEPDYGPVNSWPDVYSNILVRIEYPPAALEFLETGERVKYPDSSVNSLEMIVDSPYVIKTEDRVTIVSASDPSIVNVTYLVIQVEPEWSSVGTLHHYDVSLQTP